MNKKILEIHHLTKRLGNKEVLKNLNLTIEQGMIYGLLGVNGAGKTTTFKLIAGFMHPTSGSLLLEGMEISHNDRSYLKSLGILIERPVFYEHLSAKENLEIHCDYMGYDNVDIRKLLSLVGLDDIDNQPISQFSLGMKQRLAIARAISHKPQLLILDEPINGLDPIGIRQMRDLFLSLVNEYHMTILISSHVLSEIEHITDKVGVLVNGTIVQEVSMIEMKKRYPKGLEDYFFNIMDGGYCS